MPWEAHDGRDNLSLVLVLLSWLVFFGVYVTGAPGTIYFEDSPELLTCAWMLGNTHPPGYPLLCLLGRLVEMVPVGTPAFRFNLMSAAFGAAAAVALGALAFLLTSRVAGRAFAVLSAVFAAGVWGFSGSFWWQALIGDKYALFYFLFALVVLLSLRSALHKDPVPARPPLVAAFIFGAALTHHVYAVFAVPVLLLAVLRPILSAEHRGRLRSFLLVCVLALLPFSLKLIYPPVRSVASAAMNWGKPETGARLYSYLGAKVYHESLSSSAVSARPGYLPDSLLLFRVLLREELPFVLLLGILPGLFILFRALFLPAAALLCCMALTAGYSLNFFGEVVRWYEPFYALTAVVSAVGFAWAGWTVDRVRGKRLGRTLVGAIAVLGVLMQANRGRVRNSLSGFYGAHDLARNISMSLPRNSVYLGVGDFDLFPLWEFLLVEGERPDVTAVGLASFVDPQLAGVGMMDGLLEELGFTAGGPEPLVKLVKRAYSGRSVMMAGVAYQKELHKLMPFLDRRAIRGIVARPVGRLDPAQSYSFSRRLIRAYTLRGLMYERRGAWWDTDRPRDEVARAAFMCYAVSLGSLGEQIFRYGYQSEAAWAFDRARRFMTAVAGPVDLPKVARTASAERRIQAGRATLSLLYQRLAGIYAARGVAPRAEEFMDSAAAWAQ